ncbi:Periplasmic serine endoprotease DegP-like precursor [Rickettsiales endosymbiont of Paramecium tredecaurelia]|uniref:Do family serine endopeptidase n=1 Tax=Candidatus Sarmatiella mevalonica TaxID=2770581 RepID=UPI0019237143|nr:Do family serine endopeptidase [Candidatus Sarmatiella mevalonica]MBL3284967.1 Periplasmic serine endoprotease DegP-like precursor [Candidatus Sarmatiella mevalonica]
MLCNVSVASQGQNAKSSSKKSFQLDVKKNKNKKCTPINRAAVAKASSANNNVSASDAEKVVAGVEAKSHDASSQDAQPKSPDASKQDVQGGDGPTLTADSKKTVEEGKKFWPWAGRGAQDSLKARGGQVPASFADIVQPLIPAVVNVYTVRYNKNSTHNNHLPGFPFEEFNELLEQFNMRGFNFDNYSNPKATAVGSGFIIEPGDLLVTNHHVIEGGDEIYIKLVDGTEIPVKLLGSDKRSDLALLKIETKQPLAFVKFGDSTKMRVGDWTIAIGNPFGLGGTVTTGIISSKNRDIEMTDTGNIIDDFIQTDAAINRGNSGGPLFNLDGEVIGVNCAILSPSGTNVGIGFAIPSERAQNIIAQLKKNGKVDRGRLDITIQEVTKEIAQSLNLGESCGVLVTDVKEGGVGAKAGLEMGDVILEFNDQRVDNIRKLHILVADAPIGKEVKIVVLRNGKKQSLKAKIIDSSVTPQNGAATNKAEQKSAANEIEYYGITFAAAAQGGRAQGSGMQQGPAQGTEPGAQGQDIQNSQDEGVYIAKLHKYYRNAGLLVGDMVVLINQRRINSLQDVQEAFAQTQDRQDMLLLVRRNNINLFISVPVFREKK